MAMIVHTEYSGDIEVNVTSARYLNNNYAVRLTETDGMPFATITVNLGDKLPDGYAYLDTNNCPWAEEFVTENDLAEFVGGYATSGFCIYPLYKFDTNKITEVTRR